MMNPRVCCVLATFACAAPLWAQTQLTTARVASGLTQPLQVASAPGDVPGRMYIVERTGRIKVLEGTSVRPTAFLDVSSLVNTSWLEYGLLSVVFHPDYQANGYFYVNYNPVGATVADTLVVRYRRSASDPNVADPASATPILRFGFGTRREHRAGWMGFGPDGFLYITTGDGAENDPDNAAQNLTLLRGKVLRIDVNGADGVPGTADDDEFPADVNKNYAIPPTNPFASHATNAKEVWAYGLRNPWRASFDRETGDLWIGDVGQNTREEVDFQPAGAPGGRNYGWRCTEGTFCPGLTGCTCNGAGLTPPVYEYPHSTGLSVTCGYVYRGCEMPDIRGTYFFADYQLSKLFSFRLVNGQATQFVDRTTDLDPPGTLAINTPSSFGEDTAGELFICDYGGEVFKIVPENTPVANIAFGQQPQDGLVCVGGSGVFAAAATSVAGPPTYLWRRGQDALADGPTPWGSTISGAGTASLTVSGAGPQDAGFYSVLVANACGSLASAQAHLAVVDIDFNNDGLFPDTADITDFLSVFSGGVCPTGACDPVDFNQDGIFPDTDDIAQYLAVFGGAC
ncbi:MAG: PQQ-dependent sugar dehydrogenase [Phycisphaerales bacterium]